MEQGSHTGSAHRHAQPDTARMGKLQPTCVLQGGVLQDRPHRHEPTHEVGLPQTPEEEEALDQPQVLHQRRAQPMDVRLQVHDGRRGKDLPPPATCRRSHRAPRQGEGRCESFRPRMGRILRKASQQGKPPEKGQRGMRCPSSLKTLYRIRCGHKVRTCTG